MNELREQYNTALKDLLSDEIKSFRTVKQLTQEAMAELLRVDPRSYTDLEHKVYNCSALTFVFFLLQLDDEDTLKLLKAIRALLEGIDGHDVA